ncbi:GNAT family N-acetyltransferase [Chitinimonas sp. PSY-7]|uniref:GNAT family N-acetyltransferase n=1 Tax=Chitinimonas sp. PSY-7 TaxID=3459088 RepID=UPI00403FF43A
MMDLSGSLVQATEHIFHRANGEVVDCGGYVRILTPSNPTFYWGNYLLFAKPPQTGDLPHWEACFAAEVEARQPESSHRTFSWLGPKGEVAQFLAAGYEIAEATALSCQTPVLPHHYSKALEVRPIVSETEWEDAVALQVMCRDPAHEEADYRHFKRAQFANYRRMVDAGLGHRFGAWRNGALLAELGIFANENGLARYQNVCTHPAWRRQGIAARLVYESGRWALAELGAHTLVIVADESGPQRLYRSLGFMPAGVTYSAEKMPPQAQ